MKQINSAFNTFWSDEQGQDLVEYSLLLSVLALGTVGFLLNFKSTINGIWTRMDLDLKAAS